MYNTLPNYPLLTTLYKDIPFMYANSLKVLKIFHICFLLYLLLYCYDFKFYNSVSFLPFTTPLLMCLNSIVATICIFEFAYTPIDTSASFGYSMFAVPTSSDFKRFDIK